MISPGDRGHGDLEWGVSRQKVARLTEQGGPLVKIHTIVAQVLRSGRLTRHQQRTIDTLMLRQCATEDMTALDQLTDALISGRVQLVEEKPPQPSQELG